MPGQQSYRQPRQLGEVGLKFQGYYTASNGKKNPCFHLPKDLTLTLVSGYSVPLRHRIVTRWLELEAVKPAALRTRYKLATPFHVG